MKYESIAAMHYRRLADKEAGIKHSPLFNLRECCEAAGVTPQWYGRMAHQHSGAPAPVLRCGKRNVPLYRKHEIAEWVAHIKQLTQTKEKGTVMPSLQDALQSALAQKSVMPLPEATLNQPAIPADWDDEGGAAVITETATTQPKEKPMKHLFTATNNVSRETFNYVRDNPGCTRMQALHDMETRGFNRTSVSSILASMLAQGLAEGNSTGMRTIVDEYQPLKAPSAFRKQQQRLQEEKAARRAQRKQAKIVRRSKPMVEENAPSLVLRPAPGAWSPTDVLNGLSVIQAKAVYEELQKIFN